MLSCHRHVGLLYECVLLSFNVAGLSRAGSADPDFYTQAMNVLCPLDDDCLPLEAANLKTRQVRTQCGYAYADLQAALAYFF